MICDDGKRYCDFAFCGAAATHRNYKTALDYCDGHAHKGECLGAKAEPLPATAQQEDVE